LNGDLYAVIMAGGVGSRLWPRSRAGRPKQFLDLLGPRTLLQETVDRTKPLIPLSRVLVVAGEELATEVRGQVPGLPPENILMEPGPRGTAPCIGLACVALEQRDPGAIMAVLPADHSIADAAGFRRAIAAAAQLAQRGYLVTLGVTPDQPHPGYGYIQRGKSLGLIGEHPAFQVQRFAEKPGADVAQSYVDSGDYYWNAGIFVWRVARILAEIERYLPALHAELGQVAAAWGSTRQREVLSEAWERVPRTTIDYGVMEKATLAAVLPVEMGWSDVGNWAALAELAEGDGQGNAVRGQGRHVLLDTSNSYVYTSAGRLVAVVGLEGWIVVDTPDALLICPKDRAQAVKEIVERLKAEKLEQFL
jgi:mannose-1-phosphate guanylyltransferase